MSEAISSDHDARAREARRWVVRERSGAPLAIDDLERLRRWLGDARNLRAFAHERQAWRDLEVIAPVFAAVAVPARTRRPGWGRTAAGVAGMAAAACVALAIAPTWQWLQTDFATTTGQTAASRLPDGSRAVLDTDSAIDVAYSGHDRTIRLLRGRAWFDVRHGDPRPFRVEADQGVVRDVGTAFEVEQISEGTGVAVTQGAVQASAGVGAAMVLRAGDRARMKDGHFKRLPALPADQMAAWRRGEIVLRDTPLYQAIRIVGRYRRAPVYVLGDLTNSRPVSANFRIDQPDDALATLVRMRGMERLDLPGGMVILRAGVTR